jgi:prepilin-type processing-associated H-X9-DG protein/prepilin-type N-terminal cleavage/methylation domain-containing protein
MPHPRRRPAFTLVELLVVIGIVAVLVGLLLPMLVRARQTSQRTACLSKVHQILLAAQTHAVTHRGYYPLAGWLPGASASQVGDADLAMYDYGEDTFDLPQANGSTIAVTLLPVTNALALVMQAQQLVGANNDQVGTLERDSTGFIRNFTCPSQIDDPAKIAVPGAAANGLPVLYITDPNQPWLAYYTQGMSYVWNEQVLGWDTTFEPYQPGRLRGRQSGVRHADQTMLVADGLGSVNRQGAPLVGLILNLAMATVYTTGAPDPATGRAPAGVSLDHALAGDALAGNPQSFDRVRHQGMMNVGFCDGHAEARTVSAGGLSSIYIAPPP